MRIPDRESAGEVTDFGLAKKAVGNRDNLQEKWFMHLKRQLFQLTLSVRLKVVFLASMLCVGDQAFAQTPKDEAPFVVVLGIAQDDGFPQAGCRRDCCRLLANRPELASGPTCLAIIDPQSGQRWMLECTPDFPGQLIATSFPRRLALKSAARIIRSFSCQTSTNGSGGKRQLKPSCNESIVRFWTRHFSITGSCLDVI